MKIKKIIKYSLIFLLVGLILALSTILIVFTKAINEVKHIDVNINKNTISVCKIVDSNNNTINQISNENKYVNLCDLSPYLTKAFVSIEDKQFYQHNGLNYLRIIKAMLNNIRAKEFVEGASTISQQLIKNKYLTNEKSIDRKIKEMYLTIKLESKENKNDILENYINTIYYGNGAYGIAEASNRFFSKPPKELTLSECAILAGVVKSPARYSPINNIDNCIKRRNLVLSEMLEDKVITSEDYNKAVNEEIVLNIQPISNFANLDLYSRKAINEASKILKISKYKILNNNYTIHTYQNASHQNILNETISNESFYQKNEFGNIADSLSIIMDNKSAGITAVAGKSDYDLTEFKRQPGSLIKPILVYTPAYEEKLIYPCSQILDEKTTIDNYSPQNVGNKYYGNISIRDCVSKSLNIPAIKLCNQIGIEKCKEYASKAGIKFDNNDTGLSIALGGLTEGLTLEEITNSYIPFSNNGMYKKCAYISKIESPQKLTIYSRLMSENKYCSNNNAYLMTENLIYSSNNGTSKILKELPFEIASKTGTVNIKNSNLNTDAYSLAYTTQHTISTWLGNYSMDTKHHLSGNNNGGTFATKIIKNIANKLYEKDKPNNFIIPESIIKLPIDSIELNKNNDIKLAFNSPIKYQNYEIFSSENTPELCTYIYEEIPTTNFQVTTKNLTNEIKFNTVEYFDYYIYRINNNKEKLLAKTTNHNGEFVYIDEDIEYNKPYQYYIHIKSPYNSTTYQTEPIEQNINFNYNNMINYHMQNRYSIWLE